MPTDPRRSTPPLSAVLGSRTPRPDQLALHREILAELTPAGQQAKWQPTVDMMMQGMRDDPEYAARVTTPGQAGYNSMVTWMSQNPGGTIQDYLATQQAPAAPVDTPRIYGGPTPAGPVPTAAPVAGSFTPGPTRVPPGVRNDDFGMRGGWGRGSAGNFVTLSDIFRRSVR